MTISKKRKMARESSYRYYYSKGRAKRILERKKKRELTKRPTSPKINTRREDKDGRNKD
jgi:hypothetical protein